MRLGNVPTSVLNDTDNIIFAEGEAPKKQSYLDMKKDILGPETLGTTAQTIKGAINENATKIAANTTSLSDVAHKTGIMQANLNADMIDGIQGVQLALKSTVAITYYVNASTGLDTNDGLTVSTPFKTIQHAINILPQIINHNVTINIASGTYPEDISIAGFMGNGSLTIKGATVNSSANLYNINSASLIHNNLVISIIGFNFTSIVSEGVRAISNANYITINQCTCITASTTWHGINVTQCGIIYILSCIISNRNAAINGQFGVTIVSDSNSGSTNVYGLMASHGATIGKVLTQPSGTVMETMVYGGVIR